jgi:RHS repeat-associated protein
VQFEDARSYDPVGNVATVNTTLAAGTDHQAFCYDEQNRLTWAAAASGAIPCGGTNTAGTLSAASYTQSFAYDTLNRLTSGPAGAYTYGDSAHLHAATAIGSQWTGAYDAAGDLTCRAPTNATTCTGTPTGAQLSYDVEGRLSAWQNAPSSPTATDTFLYDGAGQRVLQQSTSGSTTTSTVYDGNLEAVSTTGATTTTTTYYYGGGKLLAEAVNGTVSYLATTAQGSVAAALNGSGATTAAQLYAPYGASRYASGTMSTDYGYTGQRADSTTGLDYYNARYYDPAGGQFASANTVSDGLNRYGYVGGNPTTATDPSGHHTCEDEATCGTHLGPAPTAAPLPPPPPDCQSDCQSDCPSPCDPSYCQQPPPPPPCTQNCGGPSGGGPPSYLNPPRPSNVMWVQGDESQLVLAVLSVFRPRDRVVKASGRHR